MPTLTVHFRRDFERQSAVVRINGRRRWAGTSLTTRLLLDVAEVVPLKAPSGEVKVRVTVTPGGDQTATMHMDRDRDLEVWYLDGTLELREPPATPAYA